MRLSAKSKKAAFLTPYNRTGLNNNNKNLSEKDERITSIFGIYGTGVSIGKELGFPNKNDECETICMFFFQFCIY